MGLSTKILIAPAEVKYLFLALGLLCGLLAFTLKSD